jgi:hypothetical protein
MAVSQITKSVFGSTLAVLLACSLSKAQDARVLPKHPGDTIKFEVKFDGPTADKIKTIGAGLNTRMGAPKDQSGFTTSFGANNISPSSPNSFRLEMTVPNNIATGDYFLNIGARADEGSAGYQDGQEFKLPPIHIENPRTFTPPAITVKELP